MASGSTSRGPSPRGRGRPSTRAPMVGARGSIPAWAGETRPSLRCRSASRVHPRVGGGDAPTPTGVSNGSGPSPRGRGRHAERGGDPAQRGSIPAWAGETDGRTATRQSWRVHPRVGGGDFSSGVRMAVSRGPSPRGRGRHAERGGDPAQRGSIPAWAGETSRCGSTRPTGRVHPRVGGGDCVAPPRRASGAGPSPRGRGRRGHRADRRPRHGSIPAWAGETPAAQRHDAGGGVHPRVGGGDCMREALTYAELGPSPRGRGRRQDAFLVVRVRGSIPAWAGETGQALVRRASAGVHPRVGGGDGGDNARRFSE